MAEFESSLPSISNPSIAELGGAVPRDPVTKASRLSALLGGDPGRAPFLSRHIWIWPALAALVFMVVGYWVNESVEQAMRRQRLADLNALLDASVSSMKLWMKDQEVKVTLFTDRKQMRDGALELLAIEEGRGPLERNLLESSEQAELRKWISPKLEQTDYVGFFIVSPTGVVLAADQDPPVGSKLSGYREEIFERAFQGETYVSRPYTSTLLLKDERGEIRPKLPTMFAVAPIRGESDKPIAALGLRIRPEDEFTRIMQQGGVLGGTGETFAFDRQGILLSESRFTDQLKQFGLLVDLPEVKSVLNFELRDPGVNLFAGERMKQRRVDQGLTRMAEEAIAGRDGADVDGYRSYRGVPVVGAWRWLDDEDFGVATEIEVDEAFAPVYVLRIAFRLLISLLFIATIGLLLVTLYLQRQQRALQIATLAARRLGQYTLEEKIGAGRWGTVYRASHSMLQRPTVVKLLDVDQISSASVERFEREVRLACRLSHPNTVSIFDYGRTPEGIFYYAMEYLEGLNLEELIARFGPMPEHRVLFLLRQICGSLAEAHSAGVIHRDIKPGNIVLTCRGGIHDFVKVLDFGLVKVGGGEATSESEDIMTFLGTPLYSSMEMLTHSDLVDSRTDVYSVGAVAYYLLTGSPLFSCSTVQEIITCLKGDEIVRPSERARQPVNPSLEKLIMRCLSKFPLDRPSDAGRLLRELEAIELPQPWTQMDARDWWQRFEKGALPVRELPPAAMSPTTRENPSFEYTNLSPIE